MYGLLRLQLYNRKRERTLILNFPRVTATLTASVRVEVEGASSRCVARRRGRRRRRWWNGSGLPLLQCHSTRTAELRIRKKWSITFRTIHKIANVSEKQSLCLPALLGNKVYIREVGVCGDGSRCKSVLLLINTYYYCRTSLNILKGVVPE